MEVFLSVRWVPAPDLLGREAFRRVRVSECVVEEREWVMATACQIGLLASGDGETKRAC